MKTLFKDPLARRLFSGTLFAAAFVWVAASYYGVSMNDVLWFLLMSFVLVGAMVLVGLLLAPVIIRLNRKGSLKLPKSGKAETSDDS